MPSCRAERTERRRFSLGHRTTRGCGQAGVGLRVRTKPMSPTRMNRTGSGHHQCSQNAESPCVLSRPVQKGPTNRSRPPAMRPARLTPLRLTLLSHRRKGAGSYSFRTCDPERDRQAVCGGAELQTGLRMRAIAMMTTARRPPSNAPPATPSSSDPHSTCW